jgi:hypothetical protein
MEHFQNSKLSKKTWKVLFVFLVTGMVGDHLSTQIGLRYYGFEEGNEFLAPFITNYPLMILFELGVFTVFFVFPYVMIRKDEEYSSLVLITVIVTLGKWICIVYNINQLWGELIVP